MAICELYPNCRNSPGGCTCVNRGAPAKREHTKEPWKHERTPALNGYTNLILDGDENMIAELYAEEFTDEQHQANARRIVACVNAFAGVSQKQLEEMLSGGFTVSGLDKYAKSVEKQRDDLLAALKGLHEACELALAGKDGVQYRYFETCTGHFVEAAEAMRAAEAAIASVKGGS